MEGKRVGAPVTAELGHTAKKPPLNYGCVPETPPTKRRTLAKRRYNDCVSPLTKIDLNADGRPGFITTRENVSHSASTGTNAFSHGAIEWLKYTVD